MVLASTPMKLFFLGRHIAACVPPTLAFPAQGAAPESLGFATHSSCYCTVISRTMLQTTAEQAKSCSLRQSHQASVVYCLDLHPAKAGKLSVMQFAMCCSF